MNKKINYPVLLILSSILIVFNSSCSWFGDDDNSGGSDSVVEIINQDINNQDTDEQSFQAGEYEMPKELVYNENADDFLTYKLYPIGWSKDGEFAYVVEPADEGSGFYLFELHVFDMVNNKDSWVWKLDETEEGNLETVWKENYEKFKETLNKYEITQQDNFELAKGTTKYKGNEYQITLDTKTKIEPDFGFDVISEFKVSINSEDLGVKEIYKHKEDDFSMLVGTYVPGYILSPNSGRVVVICQMERWGAEGPPNVVYFELVGSDLLLGFSAASGS